MKLPPEGTRTKRDGPAEAPTARIGVGLGGRGRELLEVARVVPAAHLVGDDPRRRTAGRVGDARAAARCPRPCRRAAPARSRRRRRPRVRPSAATHPRAQHVHVLPTGVTANYRVPRVASEPDRVVAVGSVGRRRRREPDRGTVAGGSVVADLLGGTGRLLMGGRARRRARRSRRGTTSRWSAGSASVRRQQLDARASSGARRLPGRDPAREHPEDPGRVHLDRLVAGVAQRRPEVEADLHPARRPVPDRPGVTHGTQMPAS